MFQADYRGALLPPDVTICYGESLELSIRPGIGVERDPVVFHDSTIPTVVICDSRSNYRIIVWLI
ncbi:hypothetical protein F090043F1_40320 [Parabacteroides goldsteinii]